MSLENFAAPSSGITAAATETDSQTLRALLEMRELLIQGAFKPGERIREIPLAERLSVSRTPLRLALDRLENEGLLEACPKGGFVAREFTVQDILDAIEVRGVLEGTAARLAAERLESPADAAELRICIDGIERLLRTPASGVDTLAAYIEWNSRFHAHLTRMAKSDILRRSLDRALTLPFASPSAFVLAEARSEEHREILLISNSQHRAIAEAIESREGARAEAVAREHSRMFRRSVTLAMQERRIAQIPGGSLIRVNGGGKYEPRDTALPL